MKVLYILIAILGFGFLIIVHELGHFLVAKLFKVKIDEFSIGMGPKIVSKKGKDNVAYSLRLFPIGGYVAMEGEDGEINDDEGNFRNKPAWQRLLITFAGPLTNIVIAFIIVFIIVSTNSVFGTTKVAQFVDQSTSCNAGLMIDDEIVSVDGTRVHTMTELNYEISRKGYKPISLEVLRNGEKVTINDVTFPVDSSEGVSFGLRDFGVYPEEKAFSTIVKNAFFTSKSTIKMIWDSIYDLISGRYSVKNVSGPIGITNTMSQAASSGAYTFFFLLAIISMNLGFMNLLPIPALDGGSILIILIEMITRRKIPTKVEVIIKGITFVLLLALIAVISFKDIIYLFK